MRTTVTALVVAENGGAWLKETLEALAEQSRRPDRVVAVVNGANETLSQELSASGVDAVIETGVKKSFGQAIAHAEAALDSAERTGQTEAQSDGELLWLLTEDSAPEPRALNYLVRQIANADSVAIAGPKLIDWDHPERIVELGQSITRYGSRWLLRRQELDQQQYDHLQDVMGVGPTGMLVRRSVWRQLEGFDPALPTWDDGLDFSVRARLAGYRVVVAPKARVRTARAGIAGPRVDRSRRVMRAMHRKARTAQLHRRVVYAPAILAPLYWLALPLVAVARVLWALLREQPDNMLGEFLAAFTVFFRVGSIAKARKRLRRQNSVGWGALKGLRVEPKTVRAARIIDKEAVLSAQGRLRRELHFISTGGLAVLVTSVLMSIVLGWWLYTESTLSGGSMIPLSDFSTLWNNTRMLESVPSDPFVWVLAVLGSITFFHPSLALVGFLAASIPLAALGGWLWGAQFAERAPGRALAGFAWALSPVLLGSIDHGRFPTVVLAVVLPWLLLAATRAHETWSWAGTASLLAAVALAAAPTLIPAATLMWIIGIAFRPRQITRMLSIAIAPFVLFLPKLFYVLTSGSLIDLFRDPGVTAPYEAGTIWHLLLGFPGFGLEGWGGILESLGLTQLPATLLVGVLFLPLALLALLGIFTGKTAVSIYASLLGGLGLLTAVISGNIALTTQGVEPVALWTGSGLALYWIALITLAASGTEVLSKAAAPLTAVALLAAIGGVGPLAVNMMLGQSEVRETASNMPSIVQAAGAQNPEIRTLVITATGEQQIATEVVTGPGRTLDSIRTSSYTSQVSSNEQAIAELAGSLASLGSSELAQRLQDTGISYVLLRDYGDAAERSQLQAIFDEHGAIESTGLTKAGFLWRVVDAKSQALPTVEADEERTVFTVSAVRLTAATTWWVQVIVLLAMLLLALPTGEVVERPERRRRRNRKAARIPATIDTRPAAPTATTVDRPSGKVTAEAAAEDHTADEPVNEPEENRDNTR